MRRMILLFVFLFAFTLNASSSENAPSSYYTFYDFPVPVSVDHERWLSSDMVLRVAATPEDGSYVSDVNANTLTPAAAALHVLNRALLEQDRETALRFLATPTDDCAFYGTIHEEFILDLFDGYKDVSEVRILRELRYGSLSLFSTRLSYQGNSRPDRCEPHTLQECGGAYRFDFPDLMSPGLQMLLLVAANENNCPGSLSSVPSRERDFALSFELDGPSGKEFPVTLLFDGWEAPEEMIVLESGESEWTLPEISDPEVSELLKWYLDVLGRFRRMGKDSEALQPAAIEELLSNFTPKSREWLSSGTLSGSEEASRGMPGQLFSEQLVRAFSRKIEFVVLADPVYFIFLGCPDGDKEGILIEEIVRCDNKRFCITNVGTWNHVTREISDNLDRIERSASGGRSSNLDSTPKTQSARIEGNAHTGGVWSETGGKVTKEQVTGWIFIALGVISALGGLIMLVRSRK